MAKIPKVTVTFDADLDSLKKGVKGATTEVDSFGSKVGDFSKKAALAFAAVAAAAGAMAIKIGVDAVKAASDLSETISKVNVLFGDTAKDIEKFADSAASSLGQTKQQALDAAATFATFGRAAGLSGKDLSGFSTGFVKLASDLASFNNTSPEQAINAIGSALRGEAEPLRAYGVLLDDASLRQAALELGIVNTTKNALTPQQKVLAAQALIYKQTSAAQGDFERTSDGLANKTRILTAQLENAKVTIGTALLPVVLQLANFFSEKVIPIVQKLSGAFGDKNSGLTAYIEQLGVTLSSVFIPIWNGLVNAFGSIKSAVQDNLGAFMELGGYISKYLAPIVGTVLGGAFDILGKIVSGLVTLIGGVARAINAIVSTTIDAINALINAYNRIPFFPDVSTIRKPTIPGAGGSNPPGSGAKPPGSGGTTDTTKKDEGGSFSSGGIELPKSITNNLTGNSKIVAAGMATAAEKAANAGGTNGIAGAGTTDSQNWARLTSAAEKLGGAATDSQNTARLLAQTIKMGGAFTDSQNAARLAAQGGITINVNAASVIDEEGFSRAVSDALNNSTYRGTNGASNLVYL